MCPLNALERRSARPHSSPWSRGQAFSQVGGRQVRAALVMDQAGFAFDPAAIRRAYPDIPCTSLSMCLRQSAADAARAGAHAMT